MRILNHPLEFFLLLFFRGRLQVDRTTLQQAGQMGGLLGVCRNRTVLVWREGIEYALQSTR